MKQTIQQTAVQRAMQPVARPIQPGLEPFDIYMIQMNPYNKKRMITKQS